VINNKESVKPETRERVLTATTRLGYVVEQRARSLAGGRSQVIGLLVHDVGTSYIGEIIRGIDEEMVALLMKQEKVPSILERFVDSLNAMPQIPTIASATVREGYTYPTEVRDVVAQEQVEQQQRIEADCAYASLVQQALREEAETGDVVLAGRGGQVVLLPFLSVRKEVSYLSQ
jgi:hypothetical protein